MANVQIVSDMLPIDNDIIKKCPGRPKKDMCLWKDDEYKQNYFKNYFQESKAKLGKVKCECGIEYFKVYQYKHNKTKCHKHWVQMVEQFQEKNI